MSMNSFRTHTQPPPRLWCDVCDEHGTMILPEFPVLFKKCLDQPIGKWSFDFPVKADSIEKVPVTWKLPDEEGCYWLTARMTGVTGRPVVSQRFVRAIEAPVESAAVKQLTFVVLGSSDAARAFFKSWGLRTSDRLDEPRPDTHVVVIWNATHLTADEKRHAAALCGFAGRGGRVIVLSASSWDWRELCDVRVTHGPRSSRVFPYPGLKTALLDGIDPRWLIRWNGLPGTVAFGAIEGAAMARAETETETGKILWAREPKTTVMAAVPAATGDGRIVFSQLDLQRRVDPSKPDYDPVAERVLLNLLGRESGQ